MKMMRFSESLTVQILRADDVDDVAGQGVSETINVCDYVYDDGVFSDARFRDVLHALVAKFERKARQGGQGGGGETKKLK